MNISVALMNAGLIPERDRHAAESAYLIYLEAQVPDPDLLRNLCRDSQAGLEEGIDYFEQGRAAWDKLDAAAREAAEKAIGYTLTGAAHFDVSFNDGL